MPKVKFVNEKITVDANEDEDLRTVARKNGVQLYWGPHKIANCMGMGTCCSCKVVIARGKENVSKRGLIEWAWTWIRPLFSLTVITNPDKEVRLACQARVHGDVEVETHPSTNWHGERFWN